MVIGYDASGVRIVQDSEGNVIRAGSGAQAVPLNLEGQLL